MSIIGIAYATKTNHSRKYAEAIGKALNMEAVNVAVNATPHRAELLFIVGGIYGGKSMPELLAYVGSLDGNHVKKAVLVTSSVSASMKSQTEVRALLEAKGIQVLDEIKCPGGLLFLKAGRPNAADLQRAAEAAVRLAAARQAAV